MRRKSEFLSPLITENIDGRFFRLEKSLRYYSEKLQGFVEVPIGFIFDNESIPRIPVLYALLGRTSDRAGCIHDYLCRIDSIPVVSMSLAAKVYVEANRARGINIFSCCLKWIGVFCSSPVVKYHHKFKVLDTYKTNKEA